MASEQLASEWLVLVARRCSDPRKPSFRGQWVGFVHSLTFLATSPAADFAAGAVLAGRNVTDHLVGSNHFTDVFISSP